jgi:radical SAM superfamily enzyme YgiQ (UPF0313 family)
LFFGLETYNERLLKIANKGTTVKSIGSALANASWAGIYVYAYLMIGFPTETEGEAYEDYYKTQKLIKEKVVSKAIYNPLLLYPGSMYYSHPSRYGIRNAKAPEGSDLDCLIYEYETDGMTREKTWDLTCVFTFNGGMKFKQREMDLRGGKTLTFKHDLDRIFKRLSVMPSLWV